MEGHEPTTTAYGAPLGPWCPRCHTEAVSAAVGCPECNGPTEDDAP